MRRRARVAIALTVILTGCGGSDGSRTQTTGTTAPPARTTSDPKEGPLERATCPADAENCAAATGRVIFVEAVDPDGDGDLHLVIVGGDVTLPGMSVLDIGRGLRPRRTPRIGDHVSAAGPVYTGSYGQKQIEATELHVAYR